MEKGGERDDEEGGGKYQRAGRNHHVIFSKRKACKKPVQVQGHCTDQRIKQMVYGLPHNTDKKCKIPTV